MPVTVDRIKECYFWLKRWQNYKKDDQMNIITYQYIIISLISSLLSSSPSSNPYARCIYAISVWIPWPRRRSRYLLSSTSASHPEKDLCWCNTIRILSLGCQDLASLSYEEIRICPSKHELTIFIIEFVICTSDLQRYHLLPPRNSTYYQLLSKSPSSFPPNSPLITHQTHQKY